MSDVNTWNNEPFIWQAPVLLSHEKLVIDKHSSLFVRSISNKDGTFYNIDTSGQRYKTFDGHEGWLTLLSL